MKSLVDWFRGNNVIEVVETNLATGRIRWRRPRWRLKPLFAWYDIWIGVYIDRKQRRVYFFPIPCVGLVFYWG